MRNIRRLIDIGDKELEVWMKGSGKTVIIQPGMISPIVEWEALCEEFVRNVRVVVYNRAGFGMSHKGKTIRNVKENAKDLNALIKKLGINDPILIGHSYGGLILQQFARDYPKIADGFILVDSTSYEAYKLDEVDIEGEDGDSTQAWIEKCNIYANLSKETLQDEMAGWISEMKKPLPSNKHREIEEFMSNQLMFKTLSEELESDLLPGKEKENPYTFFPETSTIIIGRDPKASIAEMVETEGLYKSEAKEIESIWQTLIRNQTMLNTNTTYILAEGAGHSVHLDKPEVIKEALFAILDKSDSEV